MPAAYNICDFVIAPSTRAEAFGRIPIEAQSCLKPIIATNIGGFLETIIENKTGFIVKNNDALQLHKKISKLLNMEKIQLEEIGKNGRKNVEMKFSNKRMCQKTLEIYNKILILNFT